LPGLVVICCTTDGSHITSVMAVLMPNCRRRSLLVAGRDPGVRRRCSRYHRTRPIGAHSPITGTRNVSTRWHNSR
jgi:hypothetical protein